MGTKCKINIQLNQKEYALVHYEMEFGRNKTIKNQAKVLYYAHQGTDTITELCKKQKIVIEQLHEFLNSMKQWEQMQFINASVVSESITWNKYLMNYKLILMKILRKMCLMRSEKSKKILEFLSQLRQFDTGLKQRLFAQKVKKHTCKSKHKSTVAFPEQYSFTAFKHGKKRLNDTIVLRWSAFDIWVSWWILLVQKEKICTFCLWSETSKSPWIFKPCNV